MALLGGGGDEDQSLDERVEVLEKRVEALERTFTSMGWAIDPLKPAEADPDAGSKAEP